MTEPDISPEAVEIEAAEIESGQHDGCDFSWKHSAAMLRTLRQQLTARESLLRECRAYLHRVNNCEGWYDETGAGEALATTIDETLEKAHG